MADEWTVLVYMAGDNNLSQEMVWSLQEMREVGSEDDFKIVAQFDPFGALPREFEFKRGDARSLPELGRPLGLGTIQEIIGKQKGAPWRYSRTDEDVERAARAIVEHSASPLMIQHFIAKNTGSPRRCMLVFSGHGSGAVGQFLVDSDPVSALTVHKLGELLAEVTKGLPKRPKDPEIPAGRERTIDIVGMESCHMSMGEVCFEIRDSVDYLVASEGFVLNNGWPYRSILTALKASDRKPATFAGTIVQQYSTHYYDYVVAGISTDISAIRLFEIYRLENPLKKLVKVLNVALDSKDGKRSILLAHWVAQSYSDEDYVDLGDFCETWATYYPAEAAEAKAAQDVVTAIKAVVLKSCYSGPEFQYSKGLSVYFPWSRTSFDRDGRDYLKLKFHEATRWGDFLGNLVEKTQRDPRDETELEKKKREEEKREKEELETAATLTDGVISIRKNPPHDRGTFKIPQIKNHPRAFLRDRCKVDDL